MSTTALRLGDVLTERKEVLGSRSEPTVLTLTEKNGFIPQTERFNKRLATEDTSRYKVVRRWDFAFNPYLLWAGAIAMNDRVEEGVVSPLYPIFAVRDGFDPSYLRHLLLSVPMVKRYDSIAFGSIPRRRRSSVKDFLNLELPAVPPYDEQRRIAAVFDHVGTLRTKRRQCLDLYSLLHDGLFQASRIDRRWESGGLQDVLVDGLVNGLSPATAGEVPGRVLTLSAVTAGRYNPKFTKMVNFDRAPGVKQIVSSDTFLISRGNGNVDLVGVGVVANDDTGSLVFPDTVIGGQIDLERAVPEFVMAAWRTRTVRAQIRAVARTTNGTYKVNQKGLSSVRFPLPPIDVQREFASKLIRIDALRTAAERHLARLDALSASLQARAFAGELDVSKVVLSS